jgi:integrase
MASGPYFDPRRGTWSVQYWNGLKWCRPVVVKKQPGWMPGDPTPKKPPPAAVAALGEYTKREQEARDRRSPAPEQTVATFLGAYLDAYRVSRDPGSANELRKAIRVFLDWCEARHIVRVSEVNATACHNWILDRSSTRSRQSGEPIRRSTLVKERALIAAAWSKASRRGEIEKNPWLAAPIEGKPPKKVRGSWSPDEFEKLIAHCRPWLADVLTLGCYSGLRIEALRRLEWGDILWPEPGAKNLGWIVVRPELDKAGNGYRVPINKASGEVLKRRKLHWDGGSPIILRARRGKPILANSTTDRAIREACGKAGLKDPDSPNHHMRRTFGRWAVLGHLIGEPIPMYVVSQWLGHASLTMTMKYLDMREDDSSRFMMGGNPGDFEF